MISHILKYDAPVHTS